MHFYIYYGTYILFILLYCNVPFWTVKVTLTPTSSPLVKYIGTERLIYLMVVEGAYAGGSSSSEFPGGKQGPSHSGEHADEAVAFLEDRASARR